MLPFLWLSFLSAGTIGIIAAMAVPNDLPPPGIGFAAAAAAFAAVWFALRRRAETPGRSLQFGRLAAASWCVNTAALVLYMIVQVPS